MLSSIVSCANKSFVAAGRRLCLGPLIPLPHPGATATQALASMQRGAPRRRTWRIWLHRCGAVLLLALAQPLQLAYPESLHLLYSRPQTLVVEQMQGLKGLQESKCRLNLGPPKDLLQMCNTLTWGLCVIIQLYTFLYHQLSYCFKPDKV